MELTVGDDGVKAFSVKTNHRVTPQQACVIIAKAMWQYGRDSFPHTRQGIFQKIQHCLHKEGVLAKYYDGVQHPSEADIDFAVQLIAKLFPEWKALIPEVAATTGDKHFMCDGCRGATSILRNPVSAAQRHKCEWCGTHYWGVWVENKPPMWRTSWRHHG